MATTLEIEMQTANGHSTTDKLNEKYIPRHNRQQSVTTIGGVQCMFKYI